MAALSCQNDKTTTSGTASDENVIKWHRFRSSVDYNIIIIMFSAGGMLYCYKDGTFVGTVGPENDSFRTCTATKKSFVFGCSSKIGVTSECMNTTVDDFQFWRTHQPPEFIADIFWHSGELDIISMA